eukprot:CAMPEP_0119541020 /NCGR_PEP_ID=MMETSP1344-20130328/52715_1 /TAXON_ID=236787 /ORGANISM="Florenciella parvula, Strain CCMP2471" /LENGTH=118 /DNA_ID=CAMNT_0007584923 /DNA_START=50 /DNA_END=403 /DNA_ORIENTATION=-
MTLSGYQQFVLQRNRRKREIEAAELGKVIGVGAGRASVSSDIKHLGQAIKRRGSFAMSKAIDIGAKGYNLVGDTIPDPIKDKVSQLGAEGLERAKRSSWDKLPEGVRKPGEYVKRTAR